eukprot:GHVS01071485.1.p1 GENE.GHVS01071485.1~~GHVS01071485.1.p1  ORF type:complete len:302 (+),score=63.95 GHVS01071485.1:19-924(+)
MKFFLIYILLFLPFLFFLRSSSSFSLFTTSIRSPRFTVSPFCQTISAGRISSYSIFCPATPPVALHSSKAPPNTKHHTATCSSTSSTLSSPPSSSLPTASSGLSTSPSPTAVPVGHPSPTTRYPSTTDTNCLLGGQRMPEQNEDANGYEENAGSHWRWTPLRVSPIVQSRNGEEEQQGCSSSSIRNGLVGWGYVEAAVTQKSDSSFLSSFCSSLSSSFFGCSSASPICSSGRCGIGLVALFGRKKKRQRKYITLECTESLKLGVKPSRYVTMKNKKNTPERLELMKHNWNLNKHTLHREIK